MNVLSNWIVFFPFWRQNFPMAVRWSSSFFSPSLSSSSASCRPWSKSRNGNCEESEIRSKLISLSRTMMTTLRNSCSKIFNRVTIFLESTWWKYLFKIIPYLFLEQRSNNLSGSGRRRQRGHRFRSRSFRWHSKSSFRFHLSLCSHNHFQVFFLSFGLLQTRGRIKSILLYNNKQACFPQYCRWKLFCLLFQFWMTHWRTLNIGGSITVWLVSKSTGPYSTKQENMFLNNGPTLASFLFIFGLFK